MTDRLFLLIATIGLLPVALSYGVAPATTLPFLYGFPVDGVNLTHVFRGVMGLYLANAAFWLAGALWPSLRTPALWGLLVFMAGLAVGRILSVLVDGIPGLLLVFYIVVEIVMAGGAAYFLTRRRG